MSYYFFHFIEFYTKYVELVDGGSVMNGATPSSFNSGPYIFVLFLFFNL